MDNYMTISIKIKNSGNNQSISPLRRHLIATFTPVKQWMHEKMDFSAVEREKI